MNNTTQLLVSILDGKNYNRLCVQMKVLFDYHNLWDVVESGVSALADNATDAQRVAYREQRKKDKKALYFIHQGMNDKTFVQIEGAATVRFGPLCLPLIKVMPKSRGYVFKL